MINMCFVFCDSMFEKCYAIHAQLITPWDSVLLENPVVIQLLKKFPAFYEVEGSLPHSQDTATGPCPKPNICGLFL
jgi:hypothetical protein